MSINKNALNLINAEAEKYNAKWIAVTKYQNRSMILDLYHMGVKRFGENRAQEFIEKYEELPPDIEWHFIGHLQTNKVKLIIDKANYIHSVDSITLLHTVQKEAAKKNLVSNIFIQIKIASEETKYGMSQSDAISFFYNHTAENFPNLNVVGLMGMATLTDNKDIIGDEFKSLYDLKEQINKQTTWQLNELSMGMSSDYKIALENHSTYLRIGSILFD